MPTLDKKALSERDICSKFITPALVAAKWDLMNQIREEVSFTKGGIIVRGQLETHLATARTTGARLLDATLSKLLDDARNPV